MKAIIIRFCEIHLKGKNRGYFERMLVENIKNSLKDLTFTFKQLHCRYLIENFADNDYEIIIERLKKIAGIHSFSLATVVESEPKAIIDAVIEQLKDATGTLVLNFSFPVFPHGICY